MGAQLQRERDPEVAKGLPMANSQRRAHLCASLIGRLHLCTYSTYSTHRTVMQTLASPTCRTSPYCRPSSSPLVCIGAQGPWAPAPAANHTRRRRKHGKVAGDGCQSPRSHPPSPPRPSRQSPWQLLRPRPCAQDGGRAEERGAAWFC